VLGVNEGGCCYEVEGTPPFKSIDEKDSIDSKVIQSINSAYPILGQDKK